MTTRTATVRPHSTKRDRQRTERSLIDAANAVFAERGYDAATTSEVGERAGCSQALIHRYFGSKRGLLLAVMENKASAMLDDFSLALPDRDSVHKEIEQALLWSLRVFREHGEFMRVSLAQATIDPEVGHSVGMRIHNARVNRVLDRLRRHQVAGRIRSDVDVDSVAQAVVGLGFTFGFLGQVVLGVDREYLQQIMPAFATHLARGIGVEEPPDNRAPEGDRR